MYLPLTTVYDTGVWRARRLSYTKYAEFGEWEKEIEPNQQNQSI